MDLFATLFVLALVVVLIVAGIMLRHTSGTEDKDQPAQPVQPQR